MHHPNSMYETAIENAVLDYERYSYLGGTGRGL